MTRLLLVAAVALVAGLAAAGVGVGAEWDIYPGDSIQDAVDGAGEGDTIYVHEREYCENVDVGKRLTLPAIAPLVDVEVTPDADLAMPGVQVINEIPETNRTVTITTNMTDPDDYKNITGVIADITCLDTVGDNPVSLTFISNSSATIAKYTGRFNMSDHQVGGYEVVVRATNIGGFAGTSSESFTYLQEATAPLHLSPFIIYGNVSYGDGSACNSPFVVITNSNTSEELIADNRTGEGFYQLVTSSAFANTGDVLRINAHKDGTPVGNATLTVSQTDIGNGVIKADINKRCLPDFTVVDVSFDEPLMIGDLVTINAMIANFGAAEGETSIEFYDNKSITIERSQNDYLESPINDTITLPDILRMRVHFESSGGNITIYNESRMVERITRNGWTEWCDGDTIRIESWNAGFTVDRYEAVLANKSITLGEGDFINRSAVWNLSDQCMGWVTNGTHDITVRVDPYDQVIESGETNNEKTEAVDVNPSLDFAVTEISLNPIEPVLGDVVGVSANVSNYGDRNGTTVVGVYYDNERMELERTLSGAGSNSTDTITLPPGVLGARLHLENVTIRDGEVAIYDGDGQMVERIAHSGSPLDPPTVQKDEWTDWIYGENITIRIELIPQQYDIKIAPVSTNLTWVDDLNNGTVPEDLKDRLESLGGQFTLSDNATVEKVGGGDEWIIIDEGTEKYCIRKESDELVVYYYDYYGVYEGEFTIDEYEALIAEEPVTLNATESKVVSASWRTGAAYGSAGYRNITAVVDLHNHSIETNETNNTLIEQAFVNGTDLAVTAIEIAYDLCYVRQDVTVTATIANLGAVDATNFTVIFKDGTCPNCSAMDPSGTPFTEVPIERLDSGESRSISVIWNPAEINYRTITASIPYDNTDNNETNNELPNCTDVEARYDFLVESVNVDMKDVRRGESVNITATIGSIGHEGGNVSVAFFVNSTDFAGTCGDRFTRIGTIDDVYSEVNETETASMTWDVDVAGGCHLIAAVVNPDNKIEEVDGTAYLHDTIRFRGETGNNVKNCTLQVIPLDLDITEIALAPAEPNSGEIVDVSATIKNNGDAEANSMVWFYMENDESISGSASSGTWEPGGHWSWSSALQPESPIRFHFDYIEIYKGGEVSVSVTGSQGQESPVYFYVKCKDCGGQDAKVPNIVFTTDCHEMDGTHRRWDDVWTDWTSGTAINITAAIGGNSAIMLQIDKYQVLLGNETVTLRPGESVYNSTWNTSPPLKAGEYYRGMVNVEGQKSYSNETYLHGTDLAVTNLSVKPVIRDGDMVWVNATIENLGMLAATDFIVNFTEVYTPTTGWPIVAYDHLESIDTTRIEGLGADRSINISALWNGSIRDIECDGVRWERSYSWTEYGCDDYSISVGINPLENKDKEEDVANNTKEKDVDVDKSRDFKIRELSFWVNNTPRNSSELVVYDDVTLNATLDITNLANRGGVVDVSFYIDDPCDTHKIGNTTVAFSAGNGTGYAEIEWTVDSFDDVDIVGSHNMTVVVDPENRIDEIDDDQNTTYIQPIYVRASGDLNGDGILTPADAAIALQLAATGAQNPAADVSGDDRVTSLDALMILQAAAGRIEL